MMDSRNEGRPGEQSCSQPNILIIVCGLSFAGKSTLANAICAKLGHSQVDVDETKDALFGPGIADEDLKNDEWSSCRFLCWAALHEVFRR